MTPLRRRLREDLPRRGLAPKTQQCYLDAVRQLAPYEHRPPDQRSDEELRQSCLSLRQAKNVAERPFRIHLYGLRFFDELTRKRPWPVFDLVRPRNIPKLPVVLRPRDVRDLLAVVKNPPAQMGLRLISACGLRRREGTQLQGADREPPRLLVQVRQGTGGKTRFVPLAPRVLELVRGYWQRQRPRPWVFPARHRSGPLSPTSLQKTFTAVVRQSGLAKDASSHTLRHSYATHLLERGGALRVMQALRGHKSPSTPARYAPLRPPTLAVVHATINALMADLYTPRSAARPEVADVLRRDGPESLDRFGQDRLPSHRRAIDDILHGRPAAWGGQRLQGDHGGQEHDVYHACRNRSGPQCPHQDTEAWLEERRQARLPVPYWHVVLTLPRERRDRVRRPQPDLYDILRRAAAPARIQLTAAPHDVGGLSGLLGVLHPWPRALVYHPHVHCLVPAGGVAADRTEGRPARQTYLVPVRALSQLCRGLCRDLGRQERPELALPESIWTREGGVYCKPAMPGTEQGLRYLGRDVHRSALPNSRLLSIEAGQVCFRDQDAQAHRWKPMTLPALEFIRRFLQPVLPQGFHKVRDDGLWSPVHRPLRQQLQLWLAAHAPLAPLEAPVQASPLHDSPSLPLQAGQRCPPWRQGLLVVVRLLPCLQRGPP